MRLLSALAFVICCACSHMPAGADGGFDAGGQRCWAPSGTVFEAARPATLASAIFRNGGPCFSTSSQYRLTAFRDGGIVELIEVDGDLRTKTGLEGIFYLETLAADSWVPLQRLYFAREAEGWLVLRTCLHGEPIQSAFACDGRIEFSDGGAGRTADEWLNGDGVVYAYTDGGLMAGSSTDKLASLAAHPAEFSWWAGDRAGVATLSSTNVLRLFASDGGGRELQLPRDAGVGYLFRREGLTYFSRSSLQFGGELCEADSIPGSRCIPGYVLGTRGDEAWGPPAIDSGDWVAIAYVFDGGWSDGSPGRSFIAPSGWAPDTTSLRAVQGGVMVRSPNLRRAIAWQGVRDGRDDMLLFDLPSPLVAAGVRSSVAWVSWDGGTLVSR